MARIIEATAVISGRAGDMSGFDKVSQKLTAISKAGQQVKTALAGAGTDLGKRVEEITAKLAKIENFRTMSRGLDEASLAMKRAQQEAGRLRTAIDAAGSDATRKMRTEYERSAKAVERATQAFREQGQAVRQARSALSDAGIPVNQIAAQQARLTQVLDRTTAAMHRQAQAGRTIGSGAARPPGAGSSSYPSGPVVPIISGRDAGEVAGGIGAGAAAKRIYERSRDEYLPYERDALRQAEVLGLDEAGKKAFREQAIRLGYETRYSAADIVRGQMTVAQGLPKNLQTNNNGAVVRALVEQGRYLAEAMDKTTDPVSMDMAAEMLRARLNSGGYDISNETAAAASAKRAVNELVELSKISGMNFHDLMGYTKFGEATGRTAGLSQPFMDAAVAQLRRVGFEGSMGGNFIRALSMKLSAPTRNTLDAINAAGLRYQDYQKPGTNWSVDGMADSLRRRFGRDVGSTGRERLGEIFNDEDLTGDQSKFIPAVVKALIDDGFAKKNKKGEVNAMDRERISKAAETFYRLNAESTDVQRLVTDLIFGGKITPALARYLGGAEHGGRLLNIKPGTLTADMKTMENVPPDRAQSISETTMSGAGGAYLRMVGAIEEMFRRIGEANAGPLKAFYSTIDTAATKLSQLPDGVIQFTSAVGGATAALIAFTGAARVGALLGIPGAAAAGAAGGALLGGAGAALRGAAGVAGRFLTGPFGTVLGGGALLEAARPTTKESFPYRFDTWHADAAGILERSLRAQVERMRDPEAARGRAMMEMSARQQQLEAVVKPDQITAKAEVSGSTKVEVVVTPSAAFQGLINGARVAAEAALRSGNGQGPGSTGRSMPEAAAPQVGSAPRGDQ